MTSDPRATHGRSPSFVAGLRERVHPLHRLRSFGPARRLLTVIDRPLWLPIRRVPWRVRVRFVRDLSYVLLPRGPEPGVVALFQALVELFRPARFWDIGAYFGYYTWLVRSFDSTVGIVACEPAPENADLIEATVARAGLRDVEVLRVALTDFTGRAAFTLDPVSGATGSLIAEASAAHRNWGSGRTADVATSTLDEAVGQDAEVDLIKLDIEGLEEAAVRGGLATIERCRPVIVFECFHGGAEIAAFLEPLGYAIMDAEDLSQPGAMTDNFLALPPQHAARLDELKRRTRVLREGRR